jgi:murein DD-endopeptidase MepM/ murein hydrolase activator NlpD
LSGPGKTATVAADSPAAEAKEKLAVNDRPMSGYAPTDNAYDHDPYSTGSHQTVGTAFSPAYNQYGQYNQHGQDDHCDQYATYGQSAFEQNDDQGEQTNGYGFAFPTEYGTSYDQTGTYAAYDPYAHSHPTAHTTAHPTQQATATAYYDTGDTSDTGAYDTGTLWPGAVPQQPAPAPDFPRQDWDTGGYPAYGQGYAGYAGYDYGYGYDAGGDTGVHEHLAAPAAWQPGPAHHTYDAHAAYDSPYPHGAHDTHDTQIAYGTHDAYDASAHDNEAYGPHAAQGTHAAQAVPLDTPAADEEPVRHDFAADGPEGDGTRDEPAARSRRRKPAKRSALLTIAVPSMAVMGVAAVGAAAVGGVGIAQGSAKAQADGQDSGGTAPTTQLDRQLSGVSRDADDFATRASRTQERLDLKDRQAAAAKVRAQAAARKEALRPKFVLPVTQKGLSAYFGQAGEHWMRLHTGIDFPVQTGTPVMAATDGTVRTQWNPSYGNMAIVTAPDGTETWYCHLSSTKIRSGKVQAGTVIAYSGNTGNTTGPHLHFEVRPNGGQPVDPLPWLLAHGLDPR